MNGHDLFEMIRKAADAGDQFAQNELGVAYDFGILGFDKTLRKRPNGTEEQPDKDIKALKSTW